MKQKIANQVSKLPIKRHTEFWGPVQTMFLTVAVFITSQFVASLLLVSVPLLLGATQSGLNSWLDSVGGQFIFIAVVEGLVMLLLWGLLHLKKTSFLDIGLAWPRFKDLGLAIVGFGVYFLMYLVLAVVAKLVFPSLDFNQQQEVGFQAVTTVWQLSLVFFSLVILPPLVEEVLMRGFLYTGLKNKWPTWVAVVVTSLMFAAAHLQFGSGAPLLWIAALDTFTLSLVLIYLREKTGNLGASIALHMLKNGLAFLLLFVFKVR